MKLSRNPGDTTARENLLPTGLSNRPCLHGRKSKGALAEEDGTDTNVSEKASKENKNACPTHITFNP